MTARASSVTSDASIITSVGDLMAISPKQSNDPTEQTVVTSDLLTRDECDSISVMMKEVPHYDDVFDATSLDYLDKCAESNRNHNLRNKRRESLFEKFDPLYVREFDNTSPSYSESVADLSEADGGYETGSAISVSPDVCTPAKHSIFTESINSIGVKDKHMQGEVPLIVSSEAVKSNTNPTCATPTPITTDKLIKFSGNTPPTAAPCSSHYHNHTSLQDIPLKHIPIHQKQNQEMLQLRQENRELMSLLRDMEYKHHRIIKNFEAKVKKLVEEKNNLLQTENKLLQQINDKTIFNKNSSVVIDEYEKTMSSLIGEQMEKVGSIKMVERLTKERDQALNHLTSLENFKERLSKYERAMETMKLSEQKMLYEYELEKIKYESLYMQQVTASKLANANEILNRLKKKHK